MLQLEGDNKPIKVDLAGVETLFDLSKSHTLKKILSQFDPISTNSLKFFANNNRNLLPYHTLIANLDSVTKDGNRNCFAEPQLLRIWVSMSSIPQLYEERSVNKNSNVIINYFRNNFIWI